MSALTFPFSSMLLFLVYLLPPLHLIRFLISANIYDIGILSLSVCLFVVCDIRGVPLGIGRWWDYWWRVMAIFTVGHDTPKPSLVDKEKGC